MRSTIKISSNIALNNILDNYSRLLKVQNQMSQGRRVINPSDDPLATNAGMRLDNLITRIDQYTENIRVGDSFLSLSDAGLGEVNEILNSAKSLTIGAATETTTNEMRQINATEMNNLMQSLIEIGNRKDGSRYLFAGTETQATPYEVVGGRYVYYQGNEEDINIQIDSNSFVPMNVTGESVFGSMESIISTGNLNPDINMGVDTATRLEDLNGGNGVPKGSIDIVYSAYPVTGYQIDLSAADTLEDVKDIIERESLIASQKLDSSIPANVDLRDRYLEVTINDDHNGIVIRERDAGTDGATPAGYTGNPVTIREVAANTVARDLGIDKTSIGGIINGDDLNPVLSERTLLADLDGFSEATYVISNGAKPGNVVINEENDNNNVTDNWDLSGISEGMNTDANGKLYTRVSQPVAGQYRVEIYRVPIDQALPTDMVASGSTTAAGGSVVLNEANNSGVNGTVSINFPFPVGTNVDINMQTVSDPTFTSSISVHAFEESGDPNNQLDGWHIRGLEKGVTTDANGDIYTEITTAGADHTVNIYRKDAGPAYTLIASGTLTGADEGTVTLRGVAGYEQVKGTVQLEYQADEAVAAETTKVNATFATVGDFVDAVENSNTYTSARVNESGTGIEIISHLAGAYLTVAESGTSFEQMGDENQQLRHLNLNGLATGVNSDAQGNLYTEIVDIGAGANRYQVNIYSDRARTNLVASGASAVPNGLIVINEQNQSGLSGSVDLTYVADDNSITVYPGGLRVSSDENYQLSQLDMPNIIPGTNSDFHGNLYATVVDTGAGPNRYQISLYKDPAHKYLVASGGIAGPNGTVTLTAQNGSGLGAPTSGATIQLNYTADDTDIVIKPGSLRMNGQAREDNIFATFNDVQDAMHANDTDELHDLIGNFKSDLDRILIGRADIGSRQNRLELINNRHTDERLNFGQIRSERLNLDYSEAIVEYQAHQNIYDASLRTTAQLIPMSLVDFI